MAVESTIAAGDDNDSTDTDADGNLVCDAGDSLITVAKEDSFCSRAGSTAIHGDDST